MSAFLRLLFGPTGACAMLLCALLSVGVLPNASFYVGLFGLLAIVLLLPRIIHYVIDDYRQNVHSMNELVLIAVAAAAAQGTPSGYLTAAVIALFLLCGMMIEHKSAVGARLSLRELDQMTRGIIRRLTPDGQEENLSAEALERGDVLRVRPGEVIAADGVITRGSGAVQQMNITGESLPVDKTIGDAVFAGTINLFGVIDIRVEKCGKETTLGKVEEQILNAQKTRPAFIRMIDRYAHYYTPFVLLMAFLLWMTFDQDWSRVVTLLVAACPIAFVLSMPSAAVATLSAAARAGILIKNVSDFEAARTIDTVVFDKTGTLTRGTLKVARLIPAKGVDSETLLRAAYNCCAQSNHPVSQAVAALGRQVRLPRQDVQDFTELPGEGTLCRFEGHTLRCGNVIYLQKQGIACDVPAEENEAQQWQSMSLLYVASDQNFLGMVALSDEIREETPAVLKGLRDAFGLDIQMISGDRAPCAQRVAQELGIKVYYSECKPADKIQRIEQLRAAGKKVMFVGDGVNDAPALAAADIAVAMGAAGNNLSVETASVALMNNDLRNILFFKRLSDRYRALIFQNITAGFLIILAGFLLALLTPPENATLNTYGGMISSLMQLAGVFFVVFNSARIIKLR